MLKKEDKQALVDTLKGFDVDTLIAAISSVDEVEFKVPDGVHVLPSTDLEARDINTKSEGKREGVAEGKAAGLEIAGKAIAKKFNLPSTVDTKKIDTVLEEASKIAQTGDAGLQDQIKLLQKDKETLLTEKDNLIKEKDGISFDTQLISFFPANRDASLEDSERLMLVKNTLQFETIDGKQVVKKNGEILRNPTTKDPLPVKDAISTLFTERKWTGESNGGGRGAGDSGAGGGGSAGIKKLSQAKDKWLVENPNGNPISPEFTNYAAAIAKDVTDFDWHN